jgi:hypothetical protein
MQIITVIFAALSPAGMNVLAANVGWFILTSLSTELRPGRASWLRFRRSGSSS